MTQFPRPPDNRGPTPLSRGNKKSVRLSALGAAGLAAILLAMVAETATAQSAALASRRPSIVIPDRPAPISVADVSLIRVPDPPGYRLHDLINITVDEKIDQINRAQANRRKGVAYDWSVEDFFVILSGLRLRADEQIRAQRPTAAVSSLSNMQSQYQFFRNDRIQYTLQAEVVEIKPNGNLVIEAHGTVSVNNEVNTYRLSGIVNPVDIDPRTRAVKSDHIAGKRVDLTQIGPTRDGYRRGFMVRFLDMFLPF